MAITIQARDLRQREEEKTQDFQVNIKHAQKDKDSITMPRPSQKTNRKLWEH